MMRPQLLGICMAIGVLLTGQLANNNASLQAQSLPESLKLMATGDQGDGTYRNPILNGDFADSDVERCGDRWVMITSTNHYAPGMTILESQDLVNWRYLSHVFPRLSWNGRYEADQMNGYRWGVWAGDLAYRDGEWLCYQIDYRSGLYMSKAKHLAGPWSTPVCLLEKVEWTDPAVYFDSATHTAWLAANFGKVKSSKVNDIRLFRLNWAGDKLLDRGRTIFRGVGCEAAKIHRIGERWMIMLIRWQGQGKRRDRKQLCLRSTTDSIYGPYEAKVVFERSEDTGRSACQGSLVETVDGRWWFLHQLVQNGKPVFHGRPQCLQPVSWVDGWPIVGVDSDADGIGEPIWRHAKPSVTANAVAGGRPIETWSLQTSDEFEASELGGQWNWNHNPRPDRWSLSERAGWLRLRACQPIPTAGGSPGGFWQAANTLSQRHLGVGRGRVEVKLDLSGVQPGLCGGLCHHSGEFALLGVAVNKDNERRLFFEDHSGRHLGASLADQHLYLRSDTHGDQASFAWSENGETWHTTQWTYTLVFGNWRGNRPGLFCFNERTDVSSQAGYLDVDWFHYTAMP